MFVMRKDINPDQFSFWLMYSQNSWSFWSRGNCLGEGALWTLSSDDLRALFKDRNQWNLSYFAGKCSINYFLQEEISIKSFEVKSQRREITSPMARQNNWIGKNETYGLVSLQNLNKLSRVSFAKKHWKIALVVPRTFPSYRKDTQELWRTSMLMLKKTGIVIEKFREWLKGATLLFLIPLVIKFLRCTR